MPRTTEPAKLRPPPPILRRTPLLPNTKETDASFPRTVVSPLCSTGGGRLPSFAPVGTVASLSLHQAKDSPYSSTTCNGSIEIIQHNMDCKHHRYQTIQHKII